MQYWFQPYCLRVVILSPTGGIYVKISLLWYVCMSNAINISVNGLGKTTQQVCSIVKKMSGDIICLLFGCSNTQMNCISCLNYDQIIILCVEGVLEWWYCQHFGQQFQQTFQILLKIKVELIKLINTCMLLRFVYQMKINEQLINDTIHLSITPLLYICYDIISKVWKHCSSNIKVYRGS